MIRNQDNPAIISSKDEQVSYRRPNTSNNYMKLCLITLTIRETQVKATIIFSCILTKILKMTALNVENNSYIAGGNMNETNPEGSSLAVSCKCTQLPYGIKIVCLGSYPRETKLLFMPVHGCS